MIIIYCVVVLRARAELRIKYKNFVEMIYCGYIMYYVCMHLNLFYFMSVFIYHYLHLVHVYLFLPVFDLQHMTEMASHYMLISLQKLP